MNAFQLRQQDNAFLFVGVRASDNCRDRFGVARVVRKVWHVGRDIEEIAGPHDRVVLKTLAVPDVRGAAQRVDRSLMGRVLMHKGAAAGRNREKLHVDCLRANRLRRNADSVLQTLFADERLAGSKPFAN